MTFHSSSRLTVTIAAALPLIAGVVIDIRSTLAAYLVAWIALAAIPIGALGILITTYLVRRAWTEALHPILVAATSTLPVAGVLFIPVLVGMGELYPTATDGPSVSAFKTFYLAPWIFALRTVIYFVSWSWLAWWMRNAWNESERMIRVASAGAIVYALTVSLAGVDWMESLEPEFHSSIYGLLFLSFVLLGGLAFTIGAALFLRRRIGAVGGYSGLLLSVVLLWSYLHSMQYIVIWSGNIPDEVTWYLARSNNGWQFALIVLATGQLIFPFFALLNEKVRADRRWLLALCGLTLTMRCCESSILILPGLHHIGLLMMSATFLAALIFIAVTFWWSFGLALRNEGRLLIGRAWRARGEAGSLPTERGQ